MHGGAIGVDGIDNGCARHGEAGGSQRHLDVVDIDGAIVAAIGGFAEDDIAVGGRGVLKLEEIFGIIELGHDGVGPRDVWHRIQACGIAHGEGRTIVGRGAASPELYLHKTQVGVDEWGGNRLIHPRTIHAQTTGAIVGIAAIDLGIGTRHLGHIPAGGQAAILKTPGQGQHSHAACRAEAEGDGLAGVGPVASVVDIAAILGVGIQTGERIAVGGGKIPRAVVVQIDKIAHRLRGGAPRQEGAVAVDGADGVPGI